MRTDFKKSFLRDIKKTKEKIVLGKVKQIILAVEQAETMQDIPDLKKLKGSKKGIYYRIEVDDYRIGITIENELITFVIFDTRKDIYKYFP
jgi:mRNA interferase RelE/StbE